MGYANEITKNHFTCFIKNLSETLSRFFRNKNYYDYLRNSVKFHNNIN